MELKNFPHYHLKGTYLIVFSDQVVNVAKTIARLAMIFTATVRDFRLEVFPCAEE